MGKSRAIDLTGQVFGRLTVVEKTGVHNGKTQWRCKCECGNEHVVSSTNLRGGMVKSCGCLRYVTWALKHGHAKGERTPAYRAWKSMRHRCNNKASVVYKYYGGRGITYDRRWDDFREFLADMGEPPELGYSLDRIDNERGYDKDNCRWVHRSEQAKNRRFVTWVEMYGERLTLYDAIKKHGKVAQATALLRIGKGWPVIDAIVTPPFERRP